MYKGPRTTRRAFEGVRTLPRRGGKLGRAALLSEVDAVIDIWRCKAGAAVHPNRAGRKAIGKKQNVTCGPARGAAPALKADRLGQA